MAWRSRDENRRKSKYFWMKVEMRCRLSVSSFVLSLRIASIQFCGLLNAEGNAFWMLALPNWSMSLRACAKRRFQTWSAKGYTTACTHAIYGVKQARDETRTQICMEQDTTAPNGVARARIFASNSSTRNRRTSNWYRLTVILFHLLNLFIHKLRDWGHTHNILRKERKKKTIQLYRHQMNWSGPAGMW